MAPTSSIFSRLRPRGPKKRGSDIAESPPPAAKTTNPRKEETENVKPVAVGANLSASEESMCVPERVWNAAYDGLRVQEPELVLAYERFLSRGLNTTAIRDEGENIIDQTDPQKRQSQMEELVQREMGKRRGGDWGVEKTVQGVLALNDVIGAALQPVPYAALAWAGVSFALNILTNPTRETSANREGMSYVVSRMSWYCELSHLLLKENLVDGGLSTNLRSALEGRVVDLYRHLLLYIMKSVCSYYRNQIVGFVQDMVKLHDWEGGLKAVQDAEQLVRQDISEYNTLQIRSHLEQLVMVAQDEETRLLSNIQQSVQEQTMVQQEMKRNDDDSRVLRDLCLTDPKDEMARIEQTRDQLLDGSCTWILERKDFVGWRDGQETGVYWIRGEPGKGKTMLLIGIIQDMLEKQKGARANLVSFFFCQNTDANLNTATVVLRGLIYQLAVQERSLISYIRSAYENRGKALFSDGNAFFALSRILAQMLSHPGLPRVFFIVDALDECQTDMLPMLEFLTEQVSSGRLRCLVSSRPRYEIQNLLSSTNGCSEIDLDSNAGENVKEAVKGYIEHKVADLARRKKYNIKLQEEVKDYLQTHAHGTFLWVALVCRQLQKTLLWKTIPVLKTFPQGLQTVYQRMMEGIYQLGGESPEILDYCRRILGSITVAYQPLHLEELGLVAGLPQELAEDLDSLEEMIGLCGDFVTIRDRTVYFIHQSAKDYLAVHAEKDLFPRGRTDLHFEIVSRSIDRMSTTLCKDIWGLGDPACSDAGIQPPTPDPLRYIRYACIYWIEHLCELDTDPQQSLVFCHEGGVDVFFRTHFLHWLEVLSLLRSIPSGILMIEKLESLIAGTTDGLLSLIEDAGHFIDYHRHVIENTPLQVYSSCLMFTPTSSQVRALFAGEIPSWVRKGPLMDSEWKLHMHTIRNTGSQSGIAFSPDGKFMAVGGGESSIEIWDVKAKMLHKTLSSHTSAVLSVAFSADGTMLASCSFDDTILLWSVETWLQTLVLKADEATSVAFSHDGKTLVSGSWDKKVRIFDLPSGAVRHTLVEHGSISGCTALSVNAQVASGGTDGTIRVWDSNTGDLQHDITTGVDSISSVSFSPDGELIATGAMKSVQIWQAKSGHLHRTLAQDSAVQRVAFSPIGKRLASCGEGVIQIWDYETGELEQSIEGDNFVSGITFSPSGCELAIATSVAVRIWDTKAQTSQGDLARGHLGSIWCVTVSPCKKWLATGSKDATIGLWDRMTGLLVRTLKGHLASVESVNFSPDSSRIVSGSEDSTVRVWDLETWSPLHTLRGHTEALIKTIFSPDGATIVSTGQDLMICIWDSYTGDLRNTIQTTEWPFAVTLSHDGQLVAAGCHYHSVTVWNAETSQVQYEFTELKSTTSCLAFSADGNYLVVGSMNGTVQLYSVPSAQLCHTLEAGTMIRSMAFSADRQTLVTEFGNIALDWPVSENTTAEAKWIGYGIRPFKYWITWNGRHLLQLPSECTSGNYLVCGTTVVVRYGANRLVTLDFDDICSPL